MSRRPSVVPWHNDSDFMARCHWRETYRQARLLYALRNSNPGGFERFAEVVDERERRFRRAACYAVNGSRWTNDPLYVDLPTWIGMQFMSAEKVTINMRRNRHRASDPKGHP